MSKAQTFKLRELLNACKGKQRNFDRIMLYRVIQNIYIQRQDYYRAAIYRDKLRRWSL